MRCKEVINVVDGKRLGRIIDIIIDQRRGRVLGLVVPSQKHGWPIFRACEDIFIPYNNICKIGEDVILVELMCDSVKSCSADKASIQEADTGNLQEDEEFIPTHTTYSGKIK
ncbi:MAG: YlmC/YmxH family sporulation protein [Clostridia bacterium]|nr:YlmC/YmxH family sporulation protein [Clostridia bacterium]